MATFLIGTIVLGSFLGVGYYTFKKQKKGGACCGGCKSCGARTICCEDAKEKPVVEAGGSNRL